MNGATAEPPPMTISTPISNRTMITGASHHFLRSFMKENKSFKKSITCLLFNCVIDIGLSRKVAKTYASELLHHHPGIYFVTFPFCAFVPSFIAPYTRSAISALTAGPAWPSFLPTTRSLSAIFAMPSVSVTTVTPRLLR